MAVARIALPVAVSSTFDYWIPDGLALSPGAVVRVRLGTRAQLGVVIEMLATSEVARERLHPVAAVIPEIPGLSRDLLELADFVASYYQEPIGLVVAQILPPLGAGSSSLRTRDAMEVALRLTPKGRIELPAALRRAPRARALFTEWSAAQGALLSAWQQARLPVHLKHRVRRWEAAGWVEPAMPDRESSGPAGCVDRLHLNSAQQQSVDAIVEARGRFAPFLLEGVTGSGKTEVYLAAAAQCIASGGQVLVLVPEINLTPQFEQRIATAIPGRRTVTLHSRLSAGIRRRNWLLAAAGDADLVLGTRLAVFAPLPRLALIIVDEEHDPSYKQQDGVRYHGRDVAIWRAKQRAVPVVLGSATPALESLMHVERGRYRRLALPFRAVASARQPAIALVPNRGRVTTEGISPELFAAIGARLARGEQSLVFINRRGFAPSLFCVSCGWRAGCPRCSARLVVHRDTHLLRCHHCNHSERIPRACPECGNLDLLPQGHGTQRLEAALATRFPNARIARIDRDSTKRKGSFDAVREEVTSGNIDILVGTQMLAKGHDFARLTLVGVLGADNALYSADFRATERLAALLFQVAGRAGRAQLPGEVIVQTDFPAHPLYRALDAHDYRRFTEALFAERRAASMPPFAHLALLTAQAQRRDAVDSFLAAASELGRGIARGSSFAVEVFPPVAASLARRAGLERGQILAHALERNVIQRFLPRWREAVMTLPGRRVRWALEVDPLAFA
jgi:primosomal protein N' (replication factor Y)